MRRLAPPLFALAYAVAFLVTALLATASGSAHPRAKKTAPSKPWTVWLCGSSTSGHVSKPLSLIASQADPVIETSTRGPARIILRVQMTPCETSPFRPPLGRLP